MFRGTLWCCPPEHSRLVQHESSPSVENDTKMGGVMYSTSASRYLPLSEPPLQLTVTAFMPGVCAGAVNTAMDIPASAPVPACMLVMLAATPPNLTLQASVPKPSGANGTLSSTVAPPDARRVAGDMVDGGATYEKSKNDRAGPAEESNEAVLLPIVVLTGHVNRSVFEPARRSEAAAIRPFPRLTEPTADAAAADLRVMETCCPPAALQEGGDTVLTSYGSCPGFDTSTSNLRGVSARLLPHSTPANVAVYDTSLVTSVTMKAVSLPRRPVPSGLITPRGHEQVAEWAIREAGEEHDRRRVGLIRGRGGGGGVGRKFRNLQHGTYNGYCDV